MTRAVPSHRRLLFSVMTKAERHFNKPLVCVGRSLVTIAEFPASPLTQPRRMCSPTPPGNRISCPVIPVNPAYPFLSSPAWEDEQQCLGLRPIWSLLQLKSKIWISSLGAFDMICYQNRNFWLIRVLVSKYPVAQLQIFSLWMFTAHK